MNCRPNVRRLAAPMPSSVRAVTPLALAMALAFAGTAQAAAPDELDEIVVTATRQEVRLDKVPVSVSAFTQDMLDRRGIRDIADIAAQTPGLDLRDQGQNGAGDRIAVRGIDSNTGAGTTGIYIDDTPIQARNNPINLGGSVLPEVFDLERVEVLRGPQGTLFGAGAMGGVVRFITPAPDLQNSDIYGRSQLSSVRGGDLGYEAGVALGTPLVEGKLAMRASAWYQRESGWVDRVSWQTGERTRDVNWGQTGSARLALRWQPREGVDITPSIFWQNRHENDTPTWWNTLTDADRKHPVTGFAVRQPSNDKFVLPSLKVEVQAGEVRITSITSFFHRDETNVSDVTNSDAPGNMVGLVDDPLAFVFPTVASGAPVTDLFLGATRQNSITQEIRAQNDAQPGSIRWVAGAFFQRARLQDTQYAPFDQFENLFNENVDTEANGTFVDYYGLPLLDGRYAYVGEENSSDEQLAAFGSVDWPLTQRLVLSTGLRVAHTKVKFRADENGPINGGATSTGGASTATPVTPKIGLTFQMDDDTMFYASAAKGYRVGGANSAIPAVACGDDLTGLGITEAPVQYSPDSTRSYELGAKSRALGGRLAVEASVFHTLWKNIQQYYFLPTCGYGFVSNQGRARSQGFDLNVTAKLGPSITAGLSLGYVKAKFIDEIVTQGLNERTGGATILVGNGQTLGQTPWSATGFVEYAFSLGAIDDAYVRIQDQFQGRNKGTYIWQNVDSTSYDPTLRTPPSGNRLDLRLGAIVRGFDVSLFVQNVLDASPITSSSHWIYTPGGTPETTGSPLYLQTSMQPRTIGLTATFRH